MNELQWLRQTRALKQPMAPRTDLWAGIAERIEASAPPAPTRRPRLLPWAMAASVAALSLLAGSLAWHQPTVSTPRVATHATPATAAPWQPHDPRLVGAAIELNSARRALVRAIDRAPHDTYLQQMLTNTDRQLQRLQQLQHRAG